MIGNCYGIIDSVDFIKRLGSCQCRLKKVWITIKRTRQVREIDGKLKLELFQLKSGTIKEFSLLVYISLEAISNNLNDGKQLSLLI